MKSKKYNVIAGFFLIIIPGLGQIYKRDTIKGAFILAAAIIIGNLNIIILPLISMVNPAIPSAADVRSVWAYWIPRIGHDIFSVWSIAFWLWAITNTFSNHKNGQKE